MINLNNRLFARLSNQELCVILNTVLEKELLYEAQFIKLLADEAVDRKLVMNCLTRIKLKKYEGINRISE